jgi:sensor c-di-GMP phosphodiesterase-like protein
MKRTVKQRVLVTLFATLAGVAGGALAGYWVGQEVVLRLTAARLSQEASRDIRDSESFSRDAHAALDAMNSSRYAYCSEKDLEFLRNLLYHSFLLKETGRIRDNKIVCSTTLGREHLQGIGQLKPDSIGADGVKVYRNPPIFQLPNAMVTALQAGDSFVVLNPYIYSFRELSAIHKKTTVIDAAQSHSAHPAQKNSRLTEPDTSKNGDSRIGDILYSTRCSVRYNTCMTASLSVAEALQAEHTQLRGYILFGGATGAFLGFLLSLVYRRSRSMEWQLRRAIRRDRLRLVYQPIVTLSDRRIVGAEALARWTDEEDREVGPDVFIKLAEECGFVSEITRLVVRHVLQDFRETLRSSPGFRISINVAAADLADPKFLPMLDGSLQKAGVKAQSLAIEITERSTARQQVALDTILRLRKQGFSVDIDDFGTGYSSLAYLHELSVDSIKIDKTFTHSIGTEAASAAILPQIFAMVEPLNLRVIVEGIETKAQADYFATYNQPVLGQGWYFGYPVTAEDFHRLLVEDAKKPQAAAIVA